MSHREGKSGLLEPGESEATETSDMKRGNSSRSKVPIGQGRFPRYRPEVLRRLDRLSLETESGLRVSKGYFVYNGFVKTLTEKQKKHFAKYLAANEEIIAIFGIGDRYFWINTALFFPLSFLLIGLPFLLRIIHLKHAKTYLLTNRRILIKDGVFNINLTSAPFDKITHLTVKDKFLNRISYGIGDLVVHTAASGSLPVEIVLEKIHEPLKIKNLIEELIVKEKHMTEAPYQGLVKRF